VAAEATRTTFPKTRADFWNEKFAINIARDAANANALAALGWSILTIWECETEEEESLKRRLVDFLQDTDQEVSSPNYEVRADAGAG
jgi:DNA mismatch endonuclease (patch repair protein)